MSDTLLDSQSIRRWSQLRRFGNLCYLAIDYATIALIIGADLFFYFHYRAWGLHWITLVPLWAVSIFLIGAVQHRLANMGHEAAHYMLVPDRRWNDLLGDLLCFYPLGSTLVQYRAKHFGHHLYANDAERDPNLASGRAQRLFAQFPMPKRSFIYRYYLRFFWPPFPLANLADLFQVLSVGSGFSPVPTKESKSARTRVAGVPSTWLGILYLAAFVGSIYLAGWSKNSLMLWVLPLGVYLLGVAIWAMLPRKSFSQKANLAYDVKIGGLLRMTYCTAWFWAFGWLHHLTGIRPIFPLILLWIIPLVYVFPYLMLLREVYQHTNAGQGRLDNSRIIHADFFTRWAVLSYGNDYHLLHHIYPNIPHYHVREAHEQLRRDSPAYREQAEETAGVIVSSEGRASLLDALARTESKCDQ